MLNAACIVAMVAAVGTGVYLLVRPPEARRASAMRSIPLLVSPIRF
jgi:hypothetical protein